VQIGTKSALQTLWSAMAAALDAQKLQDDQKLGSGLALGTSWGLLLETDSSPEAFQKGSGRGLRCALLEKLIFEGCI